MDSRTRFLDAARGRSVDRPPVWMMRQAGRYLPEYREVRAGTPFMEFCRDVDRAVEVSLQPWRRFATDGVIFFSDILVVPEAMGREVIIDEGGPRFPDPVRTRGDVEGLQDFDPREETRYVTDIVSRLHREIDGRAALLGFAGAPWTVACYAVEGKTSRTYTVSKALAYNEPGLMHDLLGRIADNTARYLSAQIEAGVDAVQLFDTWAGDLSPQDFAAFAAPYHARVFEQLPADTVKIIYVNGTAPHVEAMAGCGADVLSVDWRIGLKEVRRRAPGKAVQGNVDPCILLGPPQGIQAAVRACRAAGGGKGHIMNLGHGIQKETPPEHAGIFIETAKEVDAPAS